MEQACYEDENVDQSLWIPRGEEVVPIIVLKNRHAAALGERFVVKESLLLDKLLEDGRIDEEHHRTALRLAEIARRAVSKQDYTLMRVFAVSSSGGTSDADFCPMMYFQSITRGLKPKELEWIRVVCGLKSCSYDNAARNAGTIKAALDMVEKNIYARRKATEEVQDDYAASNY